MNKTIKYFIFICLVTFLSPLNYTFAQTELISNGGFESGSSNWVLSGDFYADSRFSNSHSDSGYAYLSEFNGSMGDNLLGEIYQTITIPSNATSATLTFWYSISSQASATEVFDKLEITIDDLFGNSLANVDELSNTNNTNGAYLQKSFNISTFIGQTIRINFKGTTDHIKPTVFRIDDVSIIAISPTVNPQISISPSSGHQLTTTFRVTGTGFTPFGNVTRRMQKPNGITVTLQPSMSADSNGNISWDFTPQCNTDLGISSIWIIDDTTGSDSLPVSQEVIFNTSCCTYSVSPSNANIGFNGGGDSISVTNAHACSWSVSSNDSWITITSNTNDSGDGTINYTVSANPNQSPRTGSITVIGLTETHSITIQQDGVPQPNIDINMTVSPTSIDFGDVIVGQLIHRSITITNESSSNNNLTGNVGSLPAPFSIESGGGSFNLPPGNSKSVTVRFSPASTSPFSQTLSITHNATNNSSPTNIFLSGQGVPQTHTLTVASSNPSSNVSITVRPVDINNQGNDNTSFTRTYNDRTVVTLIAPSTASGNNFKEWQRNGVEHSTSRDTDIIMDSNYTMTAVYVVPPSETFSISGNIRDSSRNAISGVNVNLSGVVFQNTTTNNSGDYSFSGLTVGNYTISPNLSGWTFSPSNITTAIAETDISGKDFIGTFRTSLHTLKVASSNPSSGVSITVSPTDNNNRGNGTTEFDRTYNNNTNITLTAPATASTNIFKEWQKNGVFHTTNQVTNITMDSDYTMTAVYVPPPDTFSISGNTRDSSGNAISGVDVNLSGDSFKSNSTSSTGNYSFSDLANGNYTVTPSSNNWSFLPLSRSIVINRNNVTDQSFTGTRKVEFPVADFTASPRNVEVSEFVNFTDTSIASSGAQIISHEWDFGDNTAKSQETNPSHSYNRFGKYTVTLDVTDSNGKFDDESKVDFINVTDLPITPTPPDNALVSLNVTPSTIGNRNVSNIDNKVNLTLLSDTALLQNQVYIQAFDAVSGFSNPQSELMRGDKLSENNGINLNEKQGGVYEATIKLFSNLESENIKIWVVVSSFEPLTISDWEERAESNILKVDNIRPNVNSQAELISNNNEDSSNIVKVVFSESMNVETLKSTSNVTVTNKTSGDRILVSSLSDTFSDNKEVTYELRQNIVSNDPNIYSINFNNNITDSAGNPLNNIDTLGVDVAEFSAIIVPLDPPVAKFSATPQSGEAPLTVQFTDESEGSINDWFWDFGDKKQNVNQNPSHEYINEGIYTVSLTVRGAGGPDNVTIEDFINVRSVPNPQISISPSSGLQLETKFVVSGTDFTPSGNVTRWLQKPNNGETITLPKSDSAFSGSADSNGEFSWEFTPSCDTDLGKSTIWVIDDTTNEESNAVEQNVEVNPVCNSELIPPVAKFTMSANSTTGDQENPLELTVSDNFASVTITFSATNSSDSNGSIESYEWKWKEDETIFSTEVDFTEVVSTGTHEFALTVTDNDDLSDSITGIIIVDVKESDVNPREILKRPIILGVSGSNITDKLKKGCCTAGTLGALVKDENNNFYILSNNHVLADVNIAQIGDDIDQPGSEDTNCSKTATDPVADLTAFVAINFFDINNENNSTLWNKTDVAIAKIRPGQVDTSGIINGIGIPNSNIERPTINMPVKKSGRNGITHGVISDINCKTRTRYKSDGCDKATEKIARFINQIAVKTTNFIRGGDSGSLLVKDEDSFPHPIGLLFASQNRRPNNNKETIISFANPINEVLDSLSQELNSTISIVGSNGNVSLSEKLMKNKHMSVKKIITPNMRDVDRAIIIQEKHDNLFFSFSEVQGTGVGYDHETGKVVIDIFVEKQTDYIKQFMPKVLENIPVKIIVTGKIYAQ